MGQRPVPIVGQPFSVQQFGVCVNVVLTCNCAMPPSTVTIVASAPQSCSLCGKIYGAMFNPANNQLQVSIAVASPQGEPS